MAGAGSIDLGLQGSTVVVTGAGPIDTPMHATWADDLDEAYRWLRSQARSSRWTEAR